MLSFWMGISLQDGLNVFSEYLNMFHDFNLMILMAMLSFIFMFMLNLVLNSHFKSLFLELELIEILWTILPCMILVILGWPSMQLLYTMENMNMSKMLSLKVTAHQWYWSYSFDSFMNLEFDAFMLAEEELYIGNLRLLETEMSVVMPIMSNIRVLVISSDVLHSWAIPSLGVKMDANPGRLNQVNMVCLQSGIFYGQCSELCGVNHSFMPIKLEFVNLNMFKEWIKMKYMLL